jgi:hypothetical protein
VYVVALPVFKVADVVTVVLAAWLGVASVKLAISPKAAIHKSRLLIEYLRRSKVSLGKVEVLRLRRAGALISIRTPSKNSLGMEPSIASVGQLSTIEPPSSARRATTPRLSSRSKKILQELSLAWRSP